MSGANAAKKTQHAGSSTEADTPQFDGPIARELALADLPEDVQSRLISRMNEIRNTNFFQPDGKPKPNWEVSVGATLSEAAKKSGDAYNRAVIVPGRRISKGGPIATRYSGRGFINAVEAAAEKAKMGTASGIKLRPSEGLERSDILKQLTEERRWHEPLVPRLRALFGDVAVRAAFSVLPAGEDSIATTYNISQELGVFAGMLGLLTLASGLDYEEKEQYTKYVEGEWEVWRKGYCCSREDNGRYFVYCTDRSGASKLPLLRRTPMEVDKMQGKIAAVLRAYLEDALFHPPGPLRFI